jgi:hypothetical protein
MAIIFKEKVRVRSTNVLPYWIGLVNSTSKD